MSPPSSVGSRGEGVRRSPLGRNREGRHRCARRRPGFRSVPNATSGSPPFNASLGRSGAGAGQGRLRARQRSKQRGSGTVRVHPGGESRRSLRRTRHASRRTDPHRFIPHTFPILILEVCLLCCCCAGTLFAPAPPASNRTHASPDRPGTGMAAPANPLAGRAPTVRPLASWSVTLRARGKHAARTPVAASALLSVVATDYCRQEQG